MTPLGEKLLKILTQIGVFLLIFIISYFLGSLFRKIIRKKLKLKLVQKEIITFTSDLVFYTSLIFGIIMALSNIGVNVSALIAGFGLGGFAVGFALKDIIANFVSGLLIILSKTFKVGDYLKIGSAEGEIKSINLRHTVLKDTQDPQKRILIPNSNIFSSIIIIRKKGKKISPQKAT